MSENTSGLSAEEFQRLQTSLLELRTSNYQLAEQISKKDREIAGLDQKSRKLEDELQKASRSKRAKANDVLDTSEPDALRQKLATQEEEFRLQQSMMIEELQKVIGQQEELEEQVRELKQAGGNSEALEKLQTENAQLKNKIEEMHAKMDKTTEDSGRTDGQSKDEEQAERIRTLEMELVNAKGAIAALEQDKKALIERMNNQSEEIHAKSTVLQKEIVELKDQLRRKQASYVSLSEEKERQLEEFKKSLDHMVQKKDAEINALVDDLNGLKRQMQMVKDNERVAAGEKASLETALKEADVEVRKVREQNEGFQIQLQETISASDCLSSQLQETRNEVERMQKQLEEANELATKRKNLLDEMSAHLEKLQQDRADREKELIEERDRDMEELKKQIGDAQKQSETFNSLQQKLLLTESLLQASEERTKSLEAQLDELKRNIETNEIRLRDAADGQKLELERQIDELRVEMEVVKTEFDRQIAEVTSERDSYAGVVQELRQEVKDKEDGLKGVDRKHQSVIKDLKRQLQNEKKRNDRLQEKIQDSVEKPVVDSSARNKSPGNTSYEEIRQTELAENRPKLTGGDAASVSSWTVVGDKHQRDSDRHSTHVSGDTADRDSESSITMLESDNHELITRVTELQKKNYELQETVVLLQESSTAMADDLVNKTTVIEQFLKEKSAFHIGGAPPSPEKIPPGLKKVIDLMKIDQSAGEIRDMNKRLQHMLEETLTKNMHLQKDLEVMSQEVARLSSAVSQEKQQRFPTL